MLQSSIQTSSGHTVLQNNQTMDQIYVNINVRNMKVLRQKQENKTHAKAHMVQQNKPTMNLLASIHSNIQMLIDESQRRANIAVKFTIHELDYPNQCE